MVPAAARADVLALWSACPCVAWRLGGGVQADSEEASLLQGQRPFGLFFFFFAPRRTHMFFSLLPL